MTGHRQAVLLCAEDDDLDLVALVHLGRLRGLDFEVRPGIEIDDAPLHGALDETPNALLVLVRSEHLSAERARSVKSTFGLARTDDQDLLAIRFEPKRVGECLETIARKLEQLGGAGDAESDAATGRLAKVGVPIDMELDVDIDLEEGSDAGAPAAIVELDVTVRASVTETDDVAPNTPAPVRLPTESTSIVAQRDRSVPIVAGVFGAVSLFASAGLWLAIAGTSDATTESEPADVAPAAAVIETAAEPVQVIEAAVPEPAPAPDDAWPPRENTPAVAATPLARTIEPEPTLAELVPDPALPKKRKGKHKRRKR